MDFCIDLLHQKIRYNKYRYTIVYITAVIDYSKFGWAIPQSFPFQISSLIKIIQFLILYKLLWLDPNSLEIRYWLAGQNNNQWFKSDIIEFDNIYIYKNKRYKNTLSIFTAIHNFLLSSCNSIIGQFIQKQCHHSMHLFAKWVKYFMDLFIICGTNSPVQW